MIYKQTTNKIQAKCPVTLEITIPYFTCCLTYIIFMYSSEYLMNKEYIINKYSSKIRQEVEFYKALVPCNYKVTVELKKPQLY